MPPRNVSLRGWLVETLASAAFAQAFATTVLTTAALSWAIEATAGAVTLATILAGLAATAVAAYFARGRQDREGLLILPVSIVLLVLMALASTLWAAAPGTTAARSLILTAVIVAAAFAAMTRDTVQLMRAFATVARGVLALSLVLEITSSVLIDVPIEVLRIDMGLVNGTASPGVFGSSDTFGIVAMLALVAFAIEWRTRSVTTVTTVTSLALAGLSLLASHALLPALAGAVTLAAVGVIVGLRRLSDQSRRVAQLSLAGAIVVGATAAWLGRRGLLAWWDSSREGQQVVPLWQSVWEMIKVEPLVGWGWVGAWDRSIAPYRYLGWRESVKPESADNAFVDMTLQLGFVGLAIFLALAALAIVRTWRAAATSPVVVSLWAPLTLIVLAITAMGSSALLGGLPLTVLIMCAVIGARRSRRRAEDRALARP